ncbi:MAG: manganese efflux pump [Polyangiaceae bacterium]|nr:manganese efflux pump [Polyangiaceae bacterium]
MPLEVILLAVALAMDATAAAATRGLLAERLRLRDVALTTLAFGGAQALMPLAGALLGAALCGYVEACDHWVAFVLLTVLGAKMIREALSDRDEPAAAATDPFAFTTMVWLAVATSIDALAAGVTLPLLGAPLIVSVAVIGVTTAILSGAGLLLGRRLGRLIGARLEVFGGLVLIGLGVKILVEHTSG